MTVCDSAWVMVGVSGVFLLGLTAAPSVLLARRAAHSSPRAMLAGALAFALFGLVAVAAVAAGQGLAQLLALAYLPAALGCAYALARPDASRIRAAQLAALVTLLLLALVVGGIAIDAASSGPCPGTEVGDATAARA